MERVETLLQQLQQQVTQKFPPEKILLTVEMMRHELMRVQGMQPAQTSKLVTVSMPMQNPQPRSASSDVQQEKIVEVLQVDEAAMEAELEEIKRNASVMQHISATNKPTVQYQPIDEIPTFIHQPVAAPKKEINEAVATEKISLNDTLRESFKELSSKLSDGPVKDLKKAIGVNDRFLFISELFRGDEAMYERSIKTINSFTIWPEAEYWIKRELKIKIGWSEDNRIVQQFDQLIRRRFA
ncbi:MAG: hypothetical protein JWR61_4953 [Ferruginibacter sp.]|uniref:hypothetical protein n=1 Tax=Ferruginibacter sp. TaxID=1940288 RepID=UPI00265AFD19|nr:hypothetical protein [Ferruginibacter sp.]MDB5279998.1 hypothetical protein [Ferruginibacter sp.]